MLQIYLILKEEKMLPLAKEELRAHQDARNFYICRKNILNSLKHAKSKNYCKVIYHCHYSGIYRGAAHFISI